MRSQQTTKLDTMSTGARYLASEILREPVKDAVKEALREEADIRAQEAESRHRLKSDSGHSAQEGSDESSGLPVGLLVAGLEPDCCPGRDVQPHPERRLAVEFQGGVGLEKVEMRADLDRSVPGEIGRAHV